MKKNILVVCDAFWWTKTRRWIEGGHDAPNDVAIFESVEIAKATINKDWREQTEGKEDFDFDHVYFVELNK